ncbi:hypothetical protein GXW78_12555 [Roseomonas terrae]|uniref:DUF3592 domain-containing protein n=1 Tax=Neoroseomonas terrae TaxID=424799 RepID=A0ABS5EHL4_9PROT|nr:hypothetical protein [Neoroseomonas terrae]MBR0650498.1 hypothetical protein [Neoroseomonas terrae]
MHAFVAVSPFVLLLTLLWLAWRVLGILQPSFIPARVRLVRPGSDGQVLVELDTQEPGGGAGTALLERPSRRAPPAGQRLTLFRGARPAVAWCSYPVLAAATYGAVALLWLALYLLFA